MPRNVKPLTDTQLRSAKPKAKEYSLADGRGLYFRVKPNGARTWVFNYYKPHTKIRTNLGLGVYPDVSLKAARDTRQKYLSLVADNVDPATYLKNRNDEAVQASSNTLQKVMEAWLATRAEISPRYARDIKSSLMTHVMPVLGDVAVGEITPVMAIDEIKPLVTQGKLETVSRICARLVRIMTFAKNTGLIAENRLYGIKDAFQSASHSNLPTIAPQELAKFMNKLAYASITLATRCLIEWQLHTMVRPGEAAGTRWKEVNLEEALWVIPAPRMKAKRVHTVPLSNHCLFLLSVMKPISGHLDYVFPADRKPKHCTSAQTANMAIKRMGYKGKLVAHGMRALASTTLNEEGFRPDIIEMALAHGDPDKVRDSYNNAKFLLQRREIMEWWSAHIEASRSTKLKVA